MLMEQKSSTTAVPRSELIARLNDQLRQRGEGGTIVVTAGVVSLPTFDALALQAALAAYDAFDADNDPHGEHDFGMVEVMGSSVMWKIDYYDKDLEYGSEDPSDPKQTTRVLTIMLAEEY
jgi:hypothetical protein